MTIELNDFHEILNEIYEEIPEKFLEGLNLGIVIEEGVEYHPEGIDNDLYVLGLYKSGPLGRGISIYFGSFLKTHYYLSRDQLKDKLRETLYHELTHHRESLAGYNDLVLEDREFIDSYKRSK